MKFLDYLLLVLLIGTMMILTSCTKDELLIEPEVVPSLEINPRLGKDENGYYHLKIKDESVQTIHRIDGNLNNITEPIKVNFTSNMSWVFPPTGEYVPMINPTSWATPHDSKISTVIAPIRSIKGDTLIVSIDVSYLDIFKTIKIVLD